MGDQHWPSRFCAVVLLHMYVLKKWVESRRSGWLQSRQGHSGSCVGSWTHVGEAWWNFVHCFVSFKESI